jgi:hypothetical protein
MIMMYLLFDQCRLHAVLVRQIAVCMNVGLGYRTFVQDSGMRQDVGYKNKLIAAAGCSGDLDFALETLAELRSSPNLTVTEDTATATIRACVACGQPSQAFTLYKQFISVRSSTHTHRMWPFDMPYLQLEAFTWLLP